MGGSVAQGQGPHTARGTSVGALALPCGARTLAWFHNAACGRKVFLVSIRVQREILS